MDYVQKPPRPEKIKAVEDMKEIFDNNMLVLTGYQGLDVVQIGELRSKLRDAGSGYKVIKNNLFKRASSGTVAEPITEDLAGATAVAYTSGDPVAVAKILKEFSGRPKPISIKSAVLDGQVFDASQIEELSKVPPIEELYGMVVGGLMSPITGLVSTMNSMLGQLVMTLQAVSDQKTD